MEIKRALFLVFCCLGAVYADEVDDYIKLINKESTRAFSFPLPSDSSAFKPATDDVSEYGVYDYIIVGAGATGAVIASRLSELNDIKILLLEVGGDETKFTDIPGVNGILDGLEYNWNYNTTPQTTACLGMINQQCAYPRGKGLGGSSITNGLFYARGNRRDYDQWYTEGNAGWSYNEVLPYFRKSEDSKIKGDVGYHGYGGYVGVEHHKPLNPQFDAFIKANLERGRRVLDYNGREQLGVSATQFTTRKGRRQSTGRCFLTPAMNRTNLKILTHSLATKILIHPENKTAYGVLFSYNGKMRLAKASKEVILSGGAINSPQLLMLSGVGPKAELEKFGIPVIRTLPVGENFQDHAAYYALQFSTNYTEPAKTLREDVQDYLKGLGPLTISGNSQGVGFFQTKLERGADYPDVEFVLVPSNNNQSLARETSHYTDETYNAVWANVDVRSSFILSVILLHPESRGNIKLQSDSPYDFPLINPNYLSDVKGHDIETMYEGIQLILDMVNTNAFKKLNASLIYAPHPKCKHHEYKSKPFWLCQLRQLTMHSYHPVGTCKMGLAHKPSSVVNHELKVHGIKNLRVADASIMPLHTSGHTYATCIMIGEKASDLIKADLKR